MVSLPNAQRALPFLAGVLICCLPVSNARAVDNSSAESARDSGPSWIRRTFAPWTTQVGKNKVPDIGSTASTLGGAGEREGGTGGGMPKHGFLGRLFRKQSSAFSRAGTAEVPARFKDLRLNIKADPVRVRVRDDRRIHVTLAVRNTGAQVVRLNFPTTLRMDVILRTVTGSVLEQWSEDRAFTDEAAIVLINPGERLEYEASLATREMTAGQRYRVEARFPAHPSLRVDTEISAVE